MKRLLIPLILASLFFASCGHKAEPVHFHRFEQLLFNTPRTQLHDVLVRDSATYNSPLLNCYPDDPEYMAILRDFVSYPNNRYIFRKTDQLYRDLSWLERDLGEAMAKAQKLCPEIVYKRYYTYINANYESAECYDWRVFCNDGDMIVAIDLYALPEMKDRNYFMMPTYLVNLCDRDHLLPDCMAAAAMDHITLPDGDLTFLDLAIYRGKILYFLDQTLPDVPEHIKLRYTPEQFSWMKENVKNVWGFLIQNQLLFSTDKDKLFRLTSEAPKTNLFGDGSAPRVCDYLGWQIVTSYMAHNRDVTLTELFADTDSRTILNRSQWQPGDEIPGSSSLLWLLVGGGVVVAAVVIFIILKKRKA